MEKSNQEYQCMYCKKGLNANYEFLTLCDDQECLCRECTVRTFKCSCCRIRVGKWQLTNKKCKACFKNDKCDDFGFGRYCDVIKRNFEKEKKYQKAKELKSIYEKRIKELGFNHEDLN